MRLMPLFFCLGLFFVPRPATADVVNEFVHVNCNPDLNVLEVRLQTVNGVIAQRYAENSDRLWKKYSLLSLDALFDVTKDGTIQEGRTHKSECLLRSQNDAKQPTPYTVIVEGTAGNVNPSGFCGLARSIRLSLKTTSAPIITDLDFLPNCSEDRGIRSISFHPSEGYVVVNAILSRGVTTTEKEQTFFLDDDVFPLTNTAFDGQ